VGWVGLVSVCVHGFTGGGLLRLEQDLLFQTRVYPGHLLFQKQCSAKNKGSVT
jgi:hypothetical protein